MTTDHGAVKSSRDFPPDYPTDLPLLRDADGFPLLPFAWVVPTSGDVAALLAGTTHTDGPDVIGDCGHVAAYGLIVPTQCGRYLCGDCASVHRCAPCDADALAAGEE